MSTDGGPLPVAVCLDAATTAAAATRTYMIQRARDYLAEPADIVDRVKLIIQSRLPT